MRILKIELPVTFRSEDPDIDIRDETVRQWLLEELYAQQTQLAHGVRERVIAYLPNDYEAFVRIQPDRTTAAAHVIIWIDDPKIRWPAGLIARRAWNLSVPILAHVTRDAIISNIANVDAVVDESRTRISSLAPMRFWLDPLILGVSVFVLTTLYWRTLHPMVISAITDALR